MQIGVVGINHKLADLKLREYLAKACQRRFGAGNSVHADQMFVLLSTCNRTEIYFTSSDLAVTHTYLLGILRKEVDEEFDHKLYSYFGIDCFVHLSRVTAGLDSAIVAETEIQGQVKSAYESTLVYSSLPHNLHYLFQKSLQIGKQVRSNLNLGRGMPNLESAILQIGSHLFENPKKSKILFVGASDINQKVLGFLQAKGLCDITLCNRSQDTAAIVSEKYRLQNLSWDQFHSWHLYDWIIFGTKAPEYLLNKSDISHSYSSNKLIIDLCVPRNVDPNVGKVRKVTLLNIDQINRTLKIRNKKMNAILNQAEVLIAEAAKRQALSFVEKEKSRQRFFALGA